MKSLQEILIENFRRISEANKVKQRDVVKKGAISEGQLSKILSGSHSPKLDSVDRIVKGLSVQPWELFVEYDKGEIGPLNTEEKEAILSYRKISDPKERHVVLSLIKIHAKKS